MSLFDGYGKRVDVTVLVLDKVKVVQVRQPPQDDVIALQVGIGAKPGQRGDHRSLEGRHNKVSQFTVTLDSLLPVGTEITALHFVPGQYVDIQVLLLLALFKA